MKNYYGYYEEYNLDFNELNKFGIYQFHAHGIPYTNKPTTEQGVLIVFDLYYVYQIYFSRQGQHFRYYNADNNTWSKWKLFFTS